MSGKCVTADGSRDSKKAERTAQRTPARAGRSDPPAAAAPGPGPDDAARLNQRLLDAQSTIERDYTRLRELDARYRHLFDGSGPLVVVEASALRVLDANAAACKALGAPLERLVGRPVSDAVDPRSAGQLESLASVTAAGVAPSGPARISVADGTRFEVEAALFRQDGAAVLMLSLEPEPPLRGRRGRPDAPALHARTDEDDASTAWIRYAAGAADGIVLTDLAGRVQHANASFVEMVQLATERQLRGESLGRWLGRTSVDLGVLVTNLRQRGTLKLFATHLRAEYGSLAEVEISAALVAVEGEAPLLGFTVRDVGRRLAGESRAGDDLSKSVGQLTELVGRVPMKEIVGNTSSLIEKMCIEAALQLTRDNRAAAAELLGLSRQSLYVKLRRYGIGDIDLEEAAET